MPEEGFLRRWARIKASDKVGGDGADAPPRDHRPVPAAPPADDPAVDPARPSPTLADVARLTPDSDYSMFVGQGVDKSVQRLALKKLFTDPRFNVMDGLDMYMDDYNIPSPVSEEMLATLEHARSALRRFAEEVPAPLPDPAAPDASGKDTAPDTAPPGEAAQDGAAPRDDPLPQGQT